MAITQGHEVVCCDRNRRGGLKTIYIVEQDRIGDVTAASGVISDFPTLASVGGAAGAGAYKFEFDRGTAGFSANASRENGSTIITVELEFYIPKVTSEVNERLNELATSCGIFAMVETYADDCTAPTTYKFVLGWDSIFEKTAYLEFASGEQSTGVGLQDANGTLVKLSGEMGEYPLEYSGVITEGATATAAVTFEAS